MGRGNDEPLKCMQSALTAIASLDQRILLCSSTRSALKTLQCFNEVKRELRQADAVAICSGQSVRGLIAQSYQELFVFKYGAQRLRLVDENSF